MLKKILNRVASRNAVTTRELAADLGLPLETIEKRFEELAARGYLQSASRCESVCAECDRQAGCRFDRDPRLWSLTAKGERALRDP